jgi:hypothetical protein
VKLPAVGALILFLLGAFAAPGRAGSPVLKEVDPPGGQRGQEIEIKLSGERLADARGILFPEPGIETVSFTPGDEKVAQAKVRIAQDAALGEHTLRVWTASGITELRTFFVGQYPTVTEAEPNNDASHAQPIPLPATVTGTLRPEQSDWYSVELKKGTRLTIEVEGMRLGRVLLDPWIAVTAPDGREFGCFDDSALFLQDPVGSIVASEDGTHRVQLRDAAFGGAGNARYRMHFTSAVQPLVLYPPGGPAGGEIEVRLIAGSGEPEMRKVALPKDTESFPLVGGAPGQPAPAPNHLRVSLFPNVLEAEPNNETANATAADRPIPLAFNGVIERAGDIDCFRFNVKKDEQLDLNVYARRVRSPLDPDLELRDAQGRRLAGNDDATGPDSYLRFKAPADGEYVVSVKDQLGRGGSDFVFRVEITPMQPAVELALPVVTQQPSQERQTIPVPRGNRYATMVRVKRSDFSGELAMDLSAPPAGLTVQPVPAAGDSVPVLFEAAPDAPVAAQLCDLRARPTDEKVNVVSRFLQGIDLVLGNPNNTAFLRTHSPRVAVGVTEEAPCRIAIVQPRVPLVQNGSMNLKVTAERRDGFAGPINIALLYNPTGIGSQAAVTIPATQNEAIIPLNASGDAPARTWKIAAVANADAGKGPVWVASQLADLEVATPFVRGKIERAKTIQGGGVEVVCNLKQERPFEGPAKIQLLNLPPKANAPDQEITAAAGEARFKVQTDKATPPGQKKDLFCRLVVVKDGEEIVHQIAQGGVLRVDAAAEVAKK